MMKLIAVLMIVSSAVAQVPEAKQFTVTQVPEARLLNECIAREVEDSQAGNGYEADESEVLEYCEREVRGAQ
jgi:hypothetical protein